MKKRIEELISKLKTENERLGAIAQNQYDLLNEQNAGKNAYSKFLEDLEIAVM